MLAFMGRMFALSRRKHVGPEIFLPGARESMPSVLEYFCRNMISFIVPAHNEEACLGRTLEAIRESADGLALAHEIIVVNDASSDRTAEIASEHKARVVDVKHRQIAATRNSGARTAVGDRLFF